MASIKNNYGRLRLLAVRDKTWRLIYIVDVTDPVDQSISTFAAEIPCGDVACRSMFAVPLGSCLCFALLSTDGAVTCNAVALPASCSGELHIPFGAARKLFQQMLIETGNFGADAAAPPYERPLLVDVPPTAAVFEVSGATELSAGDCFASGKAGAPPAATLAVSLSGGARGTFRLAAKKAPAPAERERLVARGADVKTVVTTETMGEKGVLKVCGADHETLGSYEARGGVGRLSMRNSFIVRHIQRGAKPYSA